MEVDKYFCYRLGVWVYYTDGTSEPILNYGSYICDWTITIVKLTSNNIMHGLTIGLDDFTSDVQGEQFAYFDFVMLANVVRVP